jgi:alkyldihydroxyacetonephosphate synthase
MSNGTAAAETFWMGREGESLSPEETAFVLAPLEARFGPATENEVKPPRLEDIKLETAADQGAGIAALLHDRTLRSRRAHSRQVVPRIRRGLLGDYSKAPDRRRLSAHRSRRRGGARLGRAGAASVTPFGGGSSVVGGVEPVRDAARHKAAVTVDLRDLGRVLEVDKTSRAARIEGGVFGPALEAQLRPHGLTLRHFPQSFECSTLGGWIATRSGGHFATLYTHIDDLVESLRAVTPKGVIETRRLPGSGAGRAPTGC